LKTTSDDIATGRCEARSHDRSGEYSMPAGKTYFYITCPFCFDRSKVYAWSMAGRGKRCPCGAMHDGLGRTHRKVERK
jgi:hypothetical protein